MSATIDEITEAVERLAVAVCWRQWCSLRGAGVAVRQCPTHAIIDPEALLLLSLTVQHRERRLQEALLWLASVGSSLISVQRIRTLLKTFPESVRMDSAWFAARCIDSGDRRWQTLTQELENGVVPVWTQSGKGPDELRLLDPSTLMFRLRAGFGVGVKADLLAFLVGIARTQGEREAWAPAEVIAKAISYSAASVRRAAADMTLARFVRASGDRPMEYSVDASAWARLLELWVPTSPDQRPIVPPWRFWAQMFAFLARCIEWGAESRDVSPTVQASRARDVTEECLQSLRWNDIRAPDPHMYPGEYYLEAFRELVAEVVRWADDHV